MGIFSRLANRRVRRRNRGGRYEDGRVSMFEPRRLKRKKTRKKPMPPVAVLQKMRNKRKRPPVLDVMPMPALTKYLGS